MSEYRAVIVVTDVQGEIVASQVVEAKRFATLDNYYRRITSILGQFERQYPEPEYTIHRGSGTVAAFVSVYPEVLRPASPG